MITVNALLHFVMVWYQETSAISFPRFFIGNCDYICICMYISVLYFMAHTLHSVNVFCFIDFLSCSWRIGTGLDNDISTRLLKSGHRDGGHPKEIISSIVSCHESQSRRLLVLYRLEMQSPYNVCFYSYPLYDVPWNNGILSFPRYCSENSVRHLLLNVSVGISCLYFNFIFGERAKDYSINTITRDSFNSDEAILTRVVPLKMTLIIYAN